MIAVSPSPSHPEIAGIRPIVPVETPAQWQRALSEAVRDPLELLNILQLAPQLADAAIRAAKLFPLRVPRSFVSRMRMGDPHDPLLRQVLPLEAEFAEVPGFDADPVGDLASRAAPGLLHKYAARALVVTTGACAVHCRYCFRRHFPYASDSASKTHWRETVNYLRNNTSVREVILSGGDPLSLTDARLAGMVRELADIDHIDTLRIHTRQPIVLPERVDANLCKWLADTRLRKVIVLHANHPNEIDAAVASACDRLKSTGALLLNQSVLLRSVNDDIATLTQLSQSLFDVGVLPYYLHLLDRVKGAAHFEVSESTAQTLLRGITERLPGYLVPKLVREIPGAGSKTPVEFMT